MRASIGVDVGTGSVRAGVFDESGRMLGSSSEPIAIHRPAEDYVEQSSDDIWRAACVSVRGALSQAGVEPESVAGIGFDATCSLVALDAEDRPVSLSPSGRDAQNVIVWMDHRALAEASLANATGDEVLGYVGGAVSVEMQTPKLLWVKCHLPESYARIARFFDLPDFMTYRATGRDVRSQCSTVCKWTYLGHQNEGRGRWSESYFAKLGLEDLLADGARKIGADVRPLGGSVGPLSERSARELGLVPGIAVGVSMIDAHSGGLGLLGVSLDGQPVGDDAFDERMALIGGTSSCHMALSREARFAPGIWGPYFSAMLPGLWLNEGGQSATGALIDFTIDAHARGAELRSLASERGVTAYALLNERLEQLAARAAFPAALTRELHVLPDHHGNRSPRADPTLRGMISGLKLSDTVDQLAVVYLATVQAIAHGTRHIIDTLNGHGYRISTIIASGGDTKNPVFLREHADVTGCRVVLPEGTEAVLLGAAIVGAVAAGLHPSIPVAMGRMTRPARAIEPAGGEVRSFHVAKHAVFQRMYEDQLAYRRLMAP